MRLLTTTAAETMDQLFRLVRNTDVAKVWGVGRKMKLHLDAQGIKPAMDLVKADPWTRRKKFSIVIEKTEFSAACASVSCSHAGAYAPSREEVEDLLSNRLQPQRRSSH